MGHHLRHESQHRQLIQRIHDASIGTLNFLRAHWGSGGVWVRPRRAGQSEMQYQVRNWYYFTWLSGDHIVEQHVHNLDVCNWMAQSHPVEAQGIGGRQVRIGRDFGEIFDHHAVEFTYANGLKLFSYCHHIPNAWGAFSDYAHGTKGMAALNGYGNDSLSVAGHAVHWKASDSGYQVEMDELFAAIAGGQPRNEADWALDSTMTSVLGRMATYSGKVVRWDEAINSSLDLNRKPGLGRRAAGKARHRWPLCLRVPGMTKAW